MKLGLSSSWLRTMLDSCAGRPLPSRSLLLLPLLPDTNEGLAKLLCCVPDSLAVLPPGCSRLLRALLVPDR